MHFFTNDMEKLSNVSDPPVPAEQTNVGVNAVENPPESTREDSVGSEHPVVSGSETGEVIPDVMTENPFQVEAEPPKVVLNP